MTLFKIQISIVRLNALVRMLFKLTLFLQSVENVDCTLRFSSRGFSFFDTSDALRLKEERIESTLKKYHHDASIEIHHLL